MKRLTLFVVLAVACGCNRPISNLSPVGVPAGRDSQAVLSAARQYLQAWERKDYAAEYRMLSRDADVRRDFAMYGRLESAWREKGDGKMLKPGETSQVQLCKNITVSQATMLLELTVRSDRSDPVNGKMVEKGTFVDLKKGQAAFVKHQIGGKTHMTMFIKKNGQWKALNQPGSITPHIIEDMQLGSQHRN